MTAREWLIDQMDKAWKERSTADRTAVIAEARFYAFKEVLNNLTDSQIDNQTAAESAAKE